MTMQNIRAFSIFTILLFALSAPFWLGGMFFHHFLPPSLPIKLPFGALMTFCPALAAFILLYRSGGWRAVRDLAVRVFDVTRIRSIAWLATAVLLMPAILFAAFLVMQSVGYSIRDPHVSWTLAPLLFGLFFVGAAGEELGWQGYAMGLLESGESILGVALTLGLVWAAWHVIPYFQAGHDLNWVFWQCLVTVFLRVITVWLYAYGGRSVFLATVFHAMCNVGFFLFPDYGSHYDPSSTALVLAGLTGVIAVIWGPRMLAEAHA